jgi:hypothetical protein
MLGDAVRATARSLRLPFSAALDVARKDTSASEPRHTK